MDKINSEIIYDETEEFVANQDYDIDKIYRQTLDYN